MTTDPELGLAVEERPADPAPPPEPPGRPRDDERTTRKPLAWWDRVKFLILGGGVYGFLVWNTYVQFQGEGALHGDGVGITLRQAIAQATRGNIWLLVLIGLELLRQVHYLISEHSARYYRFFTKGVFGVLDRRVGKMNAWNRYR